MEFTGKIIQVLPSVGGKKQDGNAWSKQEFVVETSGQYPKKAFFEVFGEEKFKAMPIVTGNEVTVSFDIDAREFKGRWYNSLRAWKVSLTKQTQQQPSEVLPPPPVQPSAPAQGDLPF